jgi:hypothetical protein
MQDVVRVRFLSQRVYIFNCAKFTFLGRVDIFVRKHAYYSLFFLHLCVLFVENYACSLHSLIHMQNLLLSRVCV